MGSPLMNRRQFLASSAAALAASPARPAPPARIKLGIDLFSLRSQNWTPIQYLDYCARQRAKVVHFSEIRFLGPAGLDPANLRSVREHASKLGLEVEIGMGSICPSSKAFRPQDGSAVEQLTRMIDAAPLAGSNLVRAVLGTMADRVPGPLSKHIEDTVAVLHSVRSRAMDKGVRIAIENHAGDMVATELRTLVEEAGKDFVGVCLDSGNPLWTLEDPHYTLEILHSYALTSHTRDTEVWNVPDGAAVTWVRMGQGNVGIRDYLLRFAELCPGCALSLESIVFGPRMFPWRKTDFWAAYPEVSAYPFSRFLTIAESGKPTPAYSFDRGPQLEREDLEASLTYVRDLFGI